MNIHKLLGGEPAGKDSESIGLRRAGRFHRKGQL